MNFASLHFAPGLLETAIQQLGWTLIHSLWQLTLVAVVTRGAADLLGRRSAAWRYNVLLLGLTLMVVTPLTTGLTGLSGNRRLVAGFSSANDTEPDLPVSAAEPLARRDRLGRTASSVGPAARAVGPAAVTAPQPAPPRSVWQAGREAGEEFLVAHMDWIVAAWCCGVAVAALRPACGWWMLSQLRRRGLRPASDATRAALQRAAARLGNGPAVELFESARVRMPVVIGYLRPVILWPASLGTPLTPWELEAILLHELAHVRRHDFLVNLLQTLVETVLFYHPAVWWLSRELRLEREYCCDETAAAACGDRRAYGRTLLRLDEWRDGDSVLALGAGGGTLLRRLERLLAGPTATRRPHTAGTLAGLMCLPLAVAVLAWASQTDWFGARVLATSPARLAIAAQATSDEWAQWGGSSARNNVSPVQGLPAHWSLSEPTVRWTIPLGSQTYSSPVMAQGQILIGTNNQARRNPRYPVDQDRSCLQCFSAATGEFLWEYSSAKLAAGREYDWPGIGLCSTPVVVGERIWVVTNRCELLCLDARGFLDKQNDGPVVDEEESSPQSADVVWRLDMLQQLGVTPRHQSCSSPTVAGGLVLLSTGYSPVSAPTPNGAERPVPSFLAVDVHTGQVVWSHAIPAALLPPHECFGGSPTVALIDGVAQAIFAGSDGWVYAFDLERMRSGQTELLWQFDGNPKTARRQGGGKGRRNSIIASPVVVDHRVYVVMGQNPEHGEGLGDLWCIDGRRRGDLSAERVFHPSAPTVPVPPRRDLACDEEAGEFTRPNPQSGVLWHFQQYARPGKGQSEFHETLHRAVAAPVVHEGLVYVVDMSGILFCLDATTGEWRWSDDALAAVWSTPLVADGKLFVATEDGAVRVYRVGPRRELLAINKHESPIYSTPAAAQGQLFVASRTHLTAIAATAEKPASDDSPKPPSAAAPPAAAPPTAAPPATEKSPPAQPPQAQAPASPSAKPAAGDAAGDAAVQRGLQYLRTKQGEDGWWRRSTPSETYDSGVTALVLLALLRGGESADSPVARRALASLAGTEPNFTYSIALRVVMQCALAEVDRAALQRDVDWLVAAQCQNGKSAGGWTYTRAAMRADGSCTRFALWALDVARVRGAAVPETTWRAAGDYWLRSQTNNGGWTYLPGSGSPSLSMTLAGIAGLEAVRGAVPDEQLHRRIDAAVAQAWAYCEGTLEERLLNWTQSHPMYTLHAMSLAGRLHRLDRIGGFDWKRRMTQALVDAQNQQTGSWKVLGAEDEVVNTALAILVLRPTETVHRQP